MNTIETIDNRIKIDRGLLEEHMREMQLKLAKIDNPSEFFRYIEDGLHYAEERENRIKQLEIARDWVLFDGRNRT